MSLVQRVKDSESPLTCVVLQLLSCKATSKVGASESGRVGVDSRVRVIIVQSAQGGEGSYLVVPGMFCSCPYFQVAVIEKGADWICKHLLRCMHSDGDDDMSDKVRDTYAQLRA